MLKLNKRTEYALIALRYIGKNAPGEWASVHEIANHHGIPLELLAKIMQKLKRADILLSVQGFRGGYALRRSPDEIPFTEFLALFDERMALTDCCNEPDTPCERHEQCEMRDMFSALNERLRSELERLSLGDVLNLGGQTPLLACEEQ